MCVCVCVCVCIQLREIKRIRSIAHVLTCKHTQLCLICIVMYWGIVYLKSHVVPLVLQHLHDHHTEGYE